MRKLPVAGALAAVFLLAACTAPSAAVSAASGKRPGTPAEAPSPGAHAGTGTPAPRGTAGSRGPAPGGAVQPAHVTISRLRTSDGSLVTIAAFRGAVRYVLHNGSQDPGPAAAGLVKAGPAVTGAERGRLLAAFNGGFKLSVGAGGYEQEGHVISPLRDGMASLVIDRSGLARIGVWGSTVPAPGEAVWSVRQNLQPLVLGGRPVAAAANWGEWGATLGGGEYVARSALGQDRYGDLLYAASMSATPADLAEALAAKGARIAMELDINPEWVQLDMAARPGGPLSAAVPGQVRPSNQFLTGWTRDFIAVLAAPAP